MLVSLLLSITTFFYILSLSKTTVANALLLQGTAPIWATIFAAIFLKEKINLLVFLTIIASIFGIFIIIKDNGNIGNIININNFWGNFFAIITSFGLAFQILIVRKNPHLNLIPATIVGGLIASFLSLFFKPTFFIPTKDLFILFLLGTFQIGLGYILFYRGSKDLPASLSGIITLIETFLGPIWVYLVFNEKISRNTIIGGLIIIISLLLNFYFNKRFKFE